jgi:hypothetical protein
LAQKCIIIQKADDRRQMTEDRKQMTETEIAKWGFGISDCGFFETGNCWNSGLSEFGRWNAECGKRMWCRGKAQGPGLK